MSSHTSQNFCGTMWLWILRHLDMIKLSDVDKDLLKHTWHINNGYYRGRIDGGRRVYLHKVVAERMGIQGLVDHKNMDRLDCRRENLRAATTAENNANQPGHFDRVYSKFKGVTKGKGGLWRAQISIKKVTTGLGTYDHEEDAARAYDSAALFVFGEFAQCNFEDSVPKNPSDILLDARMKRSKWGCLGVSYNKKQNVFIVFRINNGGRYEGIGRFKKLEDAINTSKKINFGL